MIQSIEAFLAYFEAVNRRALRDIGALPPEADGWRPAIGEGEAAWSINELVGHMAAFRRYFASAYLGEGWISPPAPDVSSRDGWQQALPRVPVNCAASWPARPMPGSGVKCR